MRAEVILFCLTVVLAVEGHTKEGTCPPPSSKSGICMFDPDKNCLDDHDCAGDMKCCSEGCNKECKYAIPVTYNGDCPNATGIVTTCEFVVGINCIYDSECSPIEKCCQHGCNKVCKQVKPTISFNSAIAHASTGLFVIGWTSVSVMLLSRF